MTNVVDTTKSAAIRGLLFLGGWLCLTKGGVGSVAFGLVVVAGATALSLLLLAPSRAVIDVRRLPAFFFHFVRTSLVAGVDVARRAMAVRPDLAPDLIVCDLRLASAGERVLVANLVSLLPGTLAADLEGSSLTVHALDRNQDIRGQVRSVEEQVHRLRFRSDK